MKPIFAFKIQSLIQFMKLPKLSANWKGTINCIANTGKMGAVLPKGSQFTLDLKIHQIVIHQAIGLHQLLQQRVKFIHSFTDHRSMDSSPPPSTIARIAVSKFGALQIR